MRTRIASSFQDFAAEAKMGPVLVEGCQTLPVSFSNTVQERPFSDGRLLGTVRLRS